MPKSPRTTVEPHAVRSLCTEYRMTPGDVADEIGVSPETIRTALRAGQISKPYEVAARHLLSKRSRESNGRVQLLIVCRAADVGGFEGLSRGVGAKVVNLTKLKLDD